ncbi:methyl-accepting chemotaxis protein [Hydrogenophilus thiooxidans]|uniref:methyl-accepting chemotaxis protein n=1 Tax=Hydrogenophilus thiooxidans TaxID=2820326 RepID=UPI001C2376A4|nr:methyl-accepting chemotaxis protein [Hydrogenophilus thiooxidans]
MLTSLLRKTSKTTSTPRAAPAWWRTFRGPILATVLTVLLAMFGFLLIATPLRLAEEQDTLLRNFENALLPLQAAVTQMAAGTDARAELRAIAQEQRARIERLHQSAQALRESLGFAFWTAFEEGRQQEVEGLLEQLAQLWRQTEGSLSEAMNSERPVDAFRQTLVEIEQTAQAIAALATSLSAQVADPRRAQRPLFVALLAERIAQRVNRLLTVPPTERGALLEALASDRDALGELAPAIDVAGEAPTVAARLRELVDATRLLQERVSELIHDTPRYFAQTDNLIVVQKRLPQLQKGAGALYKAVEKELETARSAVNLILMLVGVAFVGIVVQLIKNYLDLQASQRALEQAERAKAEAENRRTQEAILRLLNEMADLAEGDLTIRATVTEDVTGAIADSVNFAIEELGNLVRRINETAEQVAQATTQTQERSTNLLATAQQQSEEIEEADAITQEVAQALSRAAESANQAAQAARRSLEASQKGTLAVNQSVEGMDRIREQIQETAKRIKRLGESSQEIGEIVELISDITEQTNVLALNAAIQAAAAGEAGRGFSVVAEEVQRLAERSAEATKQIAAIVRTIQTDTHETIAAMEATTQEVVQGAALSEEARRALDEIAKTSRETAAQIARVTQEIQTQAQRGETISRLMRDVLTLTQTTRAGTEQTAEEIARLADLAAELRGSVAGFRV